MFRKGRTTMVMAMMLLSFLLIMPLPCLADGPGTAEWTAADELWPQARVNTAGGTLVLTLDKAQEMAQAQEQNYPCSALAFRAAGVALPMLWPDGPVPAEQLMVTSLLPPSAGSKAVFDGLVGRSENCRYIGTKKMSAVSPTFVFSNKATGETVFLHVKPTAFGGEKFFTLANKVQSGQANDEEQASFKALRETLLLNLLTKEAQELFTWEKCPPLRVSGSDGALFTVSYADLAVEEEGLCLCGTFGFRAFSEGIDRLWDDAAPQRAELGAAAYLPTDGTEHALKTVAGEGNYTVGGQDPARTANYRYVITNKKAGYQCTVQARDALFPDGFFELRDKCKSGQATPEEKATFKGLKNQVIWSLLFKPAEETLQLEDAASPAGDVIMTVGSRDVKVNGQTKVMDMAPVVQDNRVLVPLRFISEALGAQVEYDDVTKTITITR